MTARWKHQIFTNPQLGYILLLILVTESQKNHKTMQFTWNTQCTYNKPEIRWFLVCFFFRTYLMLSPNLCFQLPTPSSQHSAILGAVGCHCFLWDTLGSLESSPTPKCCCKTVTPNLTGISIFSAPPDLIHTSHVFFTLMFDPVSYCQGFSNQVSPSFWFSCPKLLHLSRFFLFFFRIILRH